MINIIGANNENPTPTIVCNITRKKLNYRLFQLPFNFVNLSFLLRCLFIFLIKIIDNFFIG